MNIRVGNYEIRPYPNGLCWEIFEYRHVKGKNEREDWVSMEKYPSTLGSALASVYEHTLMDEPGTKSLEEAIGTAKRLQKALMAVSKEVR